MLLLRKKRTTLKRKPAHKNKVSEEVKLEEEYLEGLKKHYEEYGSARTIFRIIYDHYNRTGKPIRTKQIYEIMKQVAGIKSKGTITKQLKKLRELGFIEKKDNQGYIIPKAFRNAVNVGIVYSHFDNKRVRKRNQLIGRKTTNKPRKQRKLENNPTYRKVMRRLRELAKKDKWLALDYFAHTVLPVRQTGILIGRMRIDTTLGISFDIFLYKENKTGKLHALASTTIGKVLDELGFGNFKQYGTIKFEELYEHTNHSAKKYIHRDFKSYANARRFHYLLKEFGTFDFQLAENLYFEEIMLSPNQIMIVIYRIDENGELTPLLQIPINIPDTDYMSTAQMTSPRNYMSTTQMTSLRISGGAVIPQEHVNKRNENTYHKRYAGF